MTPTTPYCYDGTALSHTRIKNFEQCPLAFKLHYIDGAPKQHARQLDLGTVVHAALEGLVRRAIEHKHQGPLDEAWALEALRDAWSTEKAVGSDVFEEAAGLVIGFVQNEGHFDSSRVLGMEVPFSVQVGAFTLNGVMDRVDKIDDETIEVIDYKTNHIMPAPEELQHHLQLSLYHHGARQLWPWAKKIKLSLAMIRHGIKLETCRSDQAVQNALSYVEASGKAIQLAEATDTFAARLSTSCGGCLHRLACPDYAKVLRHPPTVMETVPQDIHAIAEQRERMVALARVAENRKRELDEIIKSRLVDQPEIVAAGMRYFVRNTARRSYPLGETIVRIAQAAQVAAGDVAGRIAQVSNSGLERYIGELCKSKPSQRMTLLRAELEAVAERTYTQSLWSKPEVKSKQGETGRDRK